MLNLGQLRSRTCGGVSRRAFLRVGGLGALGLSLGDLLAMKAGAGQPSTGAIVGRVFKDRGMAQGALPPYVVLGSQLHQGLKKVVGEGGGLLGTAFDPFRMDYESGVGLKLPDIQLPESVSAQR